MIALVPIWIAAAVSLAKGISWLVRAEIAKRRAAGEAFPPRNTVAVHQGNDIPW
jgi:hypothetical protein